MTVQIQFKKVEPFLRAAFFFLDYESVMRYTLINHTQTKYLLPIHGNKSNKRFDSLDLDLCDRISGLRQYT